MHLLDRRHALAPYLGKRVSIKATACRGAVTQEASVLVRQTLCLDIWQVGGGKLAGHCWLRGADLIRSGDVGAGDLFMADCLVHRYEGIDQVVGCRVTRFGLTDPVNVLRLGPVGCEVMVREVVGLWGWEAVAEAVERLHEHGRE